MKIRDYRTNLKMEYLQKYAVGDIFIETGTYQGDGVCLALDYGFKEVHTIEIDEELVKQAVHQFAGQKVKIYNASSKDCLGLILEEIGTRPATFWLDAHEYGPNPILFELHDLKNSLYKGHTIFVDDRRLFGTQAFDYIPEIALDWMVEDIDLEYSKALLNGHQENDIICYYIEGTK